MCPRRQRTSGDLVQGILELCGVWSVLATWNCLRMMCSRRLGAFGDVSADVLKMCGVPDKKRA